MSLALGTDVLGTEQNPVLVSVAGLMRSRVQCGRCGCKPCRAEGLKVSGPIVRGHRCSRLVQGLYDKLRKAVLGKQPKR